MESEDDLVPIDKDPLTSDPLMSSSPFVPQRSPNDYFVKDGKGFDGATQLVDASMVTKAGAGTSNQNTSVWFVGNGAKRACGIVARHARA